MCYTSILSVFLLLTHCLYYSRYTLPIKHITLTWQTPLNAPCVIRMCDNPGVRECACVSHPNAALLMLTLGIKVCPIRITFEMHYKRTCVRAHACTTIGGDGRRTDLPIIRSMRMRIRTRGISICETRFTRAHARVAGWMQFRVLTAHARMRPSI